MVSRSCEPVIIEIKRITIKDVVIRTWGAVLVMTSVVPDYRGLIVVFSVDSACVDGAIEAAL